jgi:putative ATP-binding cassette transporter
VLVAGDPVTAFFKVIGRLWPWGSGRVLLPTDGPMLFMPQRPFVPVGTLRQALCYPRPPDAFSAGCIHYALECAGLAWLAPRLEESDNWEQILPLRAQQRLGFARVIMQRPAWLLMEETTDAFDPKGQT